MRSCRRGTRLIRIVSRTHYVFSPAGINGDDLRDCGCGVSGSSLHPAAVGRKCVGLAEFSLQRCVPLCVSGLLLAAVHAQHRLDATQDRATAVVWAFGVLLMALPMPSWGAALGQYRVVLWIQATAVALAAGFLLALAGRIWVQRSRMRLFLSAGTAVLAFLFAWVTYWIVTGIGVEYTGGLDGIVKQTVTFLWVVAIACTALIIGVLGHQFTAPRQGTGMAA